MIRFTLQLTLIALAMSFTTAANGQSNDWYVAPSIVYTNDAPERNIDDSLAGAQVVVGRNITDYLSVEGLLGYSAISGWCPGPASCFPDHNHLDLSANVLAF